MWTHFSWHSDNYDFTKSFAKVILVIFMALWHLHFDILSQNKLMLSQATFRCLLRCHECFIPKKGRKFPCLSHTSSDVTFFFLWNCKYNFSDGIMTLSWTYRRIWIFLVPHIKLIKKNLHVILVPPLKDRQAVTVLTNTS